MADEYKDDEGPDNYKVGEKVSMDKLLKQDADDESLRKYKESLGLSANVYAPKDDDRRVAILEFRAICDGRPGGDIIYDFSVKGSEKNMKDKPFTLKEKGSYKLQVTFRCQHELVSGLKYLCVVSRGGLKVDTTKEMIGSYAPQEKAYVVTFPRQGWEEVPSGMLARGDYKAKASFTDDDGVKHLEYEYAFSIKKDW